jgi:pyruvate kinase
MPKRRTKIMATVGPASDHPEVLAGLIEAGMDAARVGLAHGDVSDTIARIRRIRAAAKAAGVFTGVLADLPGPKVRTTPFPEAGAFLDGGVSVELVPGVDHKPESNERCIGVEHEALLTDVHAGDTIGLGDGGVTLVVDDVGTSSIKARVQTGGVLRGRPGVNLPPDRFTAAVPTAHDLKLLEAVMEEGIDAVAVSFVRSASDVVTAKKAAGSGGPAVIAKIETPSAVDDIGNIIQVADGVMVARGDLGVRCRFEDVPHIQKHIIKLGVSWALPVITATQMLESMVHAPTPTRAEVTDVANAVFDGSSMLMLSGETAIGIDPVNAVRTMSLIAERAEREFDYGGWGRNLGRQQSAAMSEAPAAMRIEAAISAAGWRAAMDAEVACIICCTRTGATARAISRFRPTAPLLAVTPSADTARRLSLVWGVQPAVTQEHGTTDEIVWFGVEMARKMGLAQPGDVVAVLAGSPTEPDAATDVLRLVRLH